MEQVLAHVVQPSKIYDAAIYFENDRNQIQQVRSYCESDNITIVDIPESPLESIGDTLDNIAKQLGIAPANNSYVKTRQLKEGFSGRTPGERYDPLSGIEQEHIDLMKYWLQATQGIRNRIAIFDWDRTISKFEGVSLMEQELANFKKPNGQPFFTAEQIREDTLRFILGGQKRLDMLRSMFRSLTSNRVDILILTNNVSCPNQSTFPFFESLVRQLVENAPFRIVCSLPFRGNKGLALQRTVLSKLCPVSVRDKSPKRN